MKASSLFAALVSVLLTACFHHDNPATLRSDAFARSSEVVDHGVSKALTRTDEQAPFELRVRLNPATCPCPLHEVFAHGHWVRAFIDADARGQKTLDSLARAGTLATVKLNGRFEDRVRRAENGATYPVFVVEEPTNP